MTSKLQVCGIAYTQGFPDGTWVDLTGSRRPEQSAVGERLVSEAAVTSRWHIELIQKNSVVASI